MSGAGEMFAAAYFDGDRPVAQPARLHMEGGALQIGLPDGALLRWPLEDIRALPDMAGRQGLVLRLAGAGLSRLYLPDRRLLAHLPQAHKSAPPKGRRRLVAWAGAAVAAVALQIFVLIPVLADNLARYIPPAGERALGAATFGHIRDGLAGAGLPPVPLCEAPGGRAALDRLTQRLLPPDALPDVVQVHVLDHEMVNAFALPGGFVVLFRGLIDAAESPDQLAAVLAHELGHVDSRDPTRHALRSAGSIGVLGLLFGDFAGGAAVLFLAERLISAQYTQEAETSADGFAHDMLNRAGISPAALGDLFGSLAEERGDPEGLIAHFLSHPRLADRVRAAKAATEPGRSYTPAMPAADWAALQAICDGPEER